MFAIFWGKQDDGPEQKRKSCNINVRTLEGCQMGQITYALLITAVVAYDIYQLIFDWFTNKLLFAVGIFVLVITLVGSCLQFLDEEDFEVKWMLWYLAPASLLTVGMLANYQNMGANALKLVHFKPAPPLIPGHASDYASAAWSHLYMMIYPFFAKLIAMVAEAFCTWFAGGMRKSSRV